MESFCRDIHSLKHVPFCLLLLISQLNFYSSCKFPFLCVDIAKYHYDKQTNKSDVILLSVYLEIYGKISYPSDYSNNFINAYEHNIF